MACLSPYYVRVDKGEYGAPCGRCPNCKRTRINQWVFRLQQEDKVSVSAYFVTLTYAQHNITLTDNKFMTLVKEDFQKFMKRLRRRDVGKIKYYACGEYGEQTMRPHYHAIIFNVHDVNNIARAWTKKGELIGLIDIGTVTEESIAYTAKYIDKKHKIPLHRSDDRLPEFSLMSKKLGINYVTEAVKKYYRNNLEINFVRTGNGYKVAMPRYFRDRIGYTEEELKQQRILAENSQAERDAEQARKYGKEIRKGLNLQDRKRSIRDHLFIDKKSNRNGKSI